MQSWQTDLLNLQLSLGMKPMLRHVGSIDLIRKFVDLSDRYVGRIAVPRGTRREAVMLPGAQFNAEWIAGVLTLRSIPWPFREPRRLASASSRNQIAHRD